jgi:hypothetical protein
MLLPNYAYLFLLMVAYKVYAYLCMSTYLLMVYDGSEGKIYQDYAVWREGKWLVGILGIEVG